MATRKGKKWQVKIAKAAPHTRDKDVEALFETVATAGAKIWFEKPEQPGLHMMRYRRGEAFSYHAVRVIFCDDGSGLEWTATYIPGSASVALNDFNEVSFQKVKE